MPDYLGNEFFSCLDELSEEFLLNGYSEDKIKKHFTEEKLSKSIGEITDLVSDKEFSYYKDKMYEIVMEEQAKTKRFLGHNEEIWGKCFAASHSMYVLATDFGQLFCDFVNEKFNADLFTKNRYIFLVLRHIHGRACQEFLEILYLLRLGFADCAFSRWRSLFELSCLSFFISKQPEIIAKQYYEQSLDDSVSQSAKRSYSWTSGAVDKNGNSIRINSFRAIQDFVYDDSNCKEVWLSQYNLANAVTHGSPEGTFGRLGSAESDEVIIVGHTDYGFAPPAENAAISLNMVTSIFLTTYPHMDSLANIRVLGKYVQLIQEMYHNVTVKFFDKANNIDGENFDE